MEQLSELTYEQRGRFFAEVLPFWSVLTLPQRQLLLNETVLTNYSAGTRVYGITQQFPGLVVLHRGLLRTFLLSEDGREATLFRLKERELFVLSLPTQTQSETMELCFEFLEDCALLCIQERAIFVLYHTVPAVQHAVLSAAFSHLHELMWATHVQSFYPLKQRLALLLLELTAECANPSVLRTTHEALARSLRSAREMVSVELESMKKAGILTTGRGKITILNRAALEALSSGEAINQPDENSAPVL